KTSPYGSVDYPFNPISLALGADATFVARAVDRDAKHLQQMLKRAAEHKGLAFIEIWQNCVIFNDGAFDDLTDKKIKGEKLLVLEHNQPMIFGTNKDKGIKLDGLKPVVINLSDGTHSIDEVLVHDEFDDNPARTAILAN